MRWSRLGPIRIGVLAFVCFITVGAAAPAAGADNAGVIGRLPRLQLPPEDQIAPVPPGGPGGHQEPTRLLEVCPVDRPFHYTDDFGDARWAGGFHRHQGVDIMAPRGTPIRAPFDGRAEKSSSWAGGLGVYVYGRRGFVFNAHLNHLGKLGKVRAGDLIGYVGNSGDARGGSPHDHFEWHPGGGRAVDPFRLLNAVCRGSPSRPNPPPRTTTFI
jgi:murein DD-endopeptidase MepM/ murein hydrolase activator NlpD